MSRKAGVWATCVEKNWQRCTVCWTPVKKSAAYWCKSSEDINLNYCPHCGAEMFNLNQPDGDSYKAIQKWLKNHDSNPKWKALFGTFVEGSPMVLFFCRCDEMPWSVQYCGNGHYFKTQGEAIEYIAARKGVDLDEH